MKICIYGASGRELAAPYYQAARELGNRIAEGGHTLLFGGGAGGLMGACAEGAAEHGGEIIGVAPRFFDEPGVLFDRCTRFVYTQDLRDRMAFLTEESDAFLVLPGGIGTYQEFFETLTLCQLGQLQKPLALINTLDCYAPLMALLEKAAEERFLSQNCFQLFALCSTPAEALRYICTAKPITGSIRRLADYSK